MKNIKLIGGVLAVAIILFIVFTRTDKGPEQITIGFIGPLTGDAAVFGDAIKSGIEIGLEDLKNDPKQNNLNVKVIYEDGKCNGKDASSAAQKLVSVDSVRYIIGGSCSGEMLAVIPVTEASKVIAFSPSASNAKISEMGDYVFRNHPSDSFAGIELARLTSSFKKVAIITSQTEYSEGIKKVFKDELEKNGQRLVFDEEVLAGIKDFRTVLSKLKSSVPDAIFLNAQDGPTFAVMANQARELGITAQFFGAYYTGADVTGSGSAVEGSIMVDVPGLSESEIGKHISSAYKEKYGKDPEYAYFIGSGYDALMLLIKGITAEGDNTSKVKDYLYGVKNYNGAIGNYGFNEKGDLEGIHLVVKKIQNGKAVEIK